MAATSRPCAELALSGPGPCLHNVPAVIALRRPPPDTRQLQRCLLLAVLLHVWLVLMFGNATGSAAPGQGVWGSLTVKLQGRSGGDPDAPPAETAERSGGPAPREASPAAPGSRQTRQPDLPTPEDRSTEPPRTATLSLPEGFRPIEHQDLSPPPRAEIQPLPTPDLPATAIGRLETQPETAVAPLAPAAGLRSPHRATEALPQAAALPTTVNRLEAAPTPAATALPRPAELRVAPPQAAAPSADLPATVQRLEAPAVTPTRLPRAADLRTPAPGVGAPPVPSAALPSAVQRLEAADSAPAPATALPRPAELRMASPAAATALPSPQDLPTAVRRLESADAAGSDVTPLRPVPNARASLPAPATSALKELAGAVPGAVAAPAGPAQGDPHANPFAAAPKAAGGSPDAGSRLGPDLPPPPTAAASTPGRTPLNLSLPRGDMTARRGTGVIEMIPPPPERKSKLEQSIEEAANKDCRKAYSGAGLLAVVPLAIDAARGKGCKW